MKYNLVLPEFEIEQENKASGRKYSINGQRKYASVTTITGKFMDTYALQVWKRNNPDSAEISKKASSIGTKVHKLNEAFFTEQDISHLEFSKEEQGRHSLYLPLLNKVTPLLVEKKIYWETLHKDQWVGFGGTLDLAGVIENPSEVFLDFEDNSPMFFVADYKNWSNSKSPDRLVHTCLQVAAYLAAVNYLAKGQYQFTHGMIIGTTKRKLHVFYLNLDLLKWYWHWFQQLIYIYYGTSTLPFNWAYFHSLSAGYMKDEETDEWIDRDKKYLPTKLTLI